MPRLITRNELVILFILLSLLIRNYYSFYHKSSYATTNDKDKVLVDEFIDTPIFEELLDTPTNKENTKETIEQPTPISEKERIKSWKKNIKGRPELHKPFRS